MPPLDGGNEHLLSILYEIGPSMASGMGDGPITFQEILAWQITTGTRLSTWEARTLRRMSIEYLNERQRAEKYGCEPPWKARDAKPEPTAAQLAMRALANL